MGHRIDQRVQFCTAPDGTRIAYAITGNGQPIVRAAHYLSHLEFDFESPVWRHWIRELSVNNMYVRYDERGCGLSDWNTLNFSFQAWVRDLETVVDSLSLDRFVLLGVSQGGPVAIAYTARHPERVSRLVLYGAYAHGWAKREETLQNPESAKRRKAMHELIQPGWGHDNPAYRQLFTSLFMPDAGPEQMKWFNELQRVSCTPENASKFDDVFADVDVAELLPKVRVPTLILHARHDSVVPLEQGRLLAAQIPGAKFVSFEGRNHILLENEPGWQTFLREFRDFTRVSPHDKVTIENIRSDYPDDGELSEFKNTIDQMDHIAISRFNVVGNYVRYDPDVRNSLKDWKQKIIAGLQSQAPRTHSYLIWAPAGSGKSFFVQEIARLLGDNVDYTDLNLARLDEDEFRLRLAELNRRQRGCLCLIDEIDARPSESWPYEALLPSLDRPDIKTSMVFVLAGSSTSGIEEMKQRLGSRPKGPDLLSRVPAGNQFVVPQLSPVDRALVALVQLRHAGRQIGRPVNEVEKLALYYACLNPRISNARQIREFANQSVERLPPGEDRVKYDHLFAPGDQENKEFWARTEPVRKGLAGAFVSISD